MINRATYFIGLLLFVAGCGKEPTVTPPDRALLGKLNIDSRPVPQYHSNLPFVPGWPMLKTETFTDTTSNNYYLPSTYYYYYDESWRLIKMERTGSSPYTEEYEYAPGVVLRNGYTWLILNQHGLASHDASYDASSRTYSFNADSNLISESNNYGAENYSYTIDHNKSYEYGWVEASSYHINNNRTYYYNNHRNTTGNYNRGEYYMGKSSVNLADHDYIEEVYTGGGYPHKEFNTYHYTYNDSGWVSRLEQIRGEIYPVQIDSVTTIIDTSYTMYRFDYTYY